MTKQEFMDKKSKNSTEINVLQLMLGMSKTQLLTTLRHLKMVTKALYTTDMKKATVEELLKQVTTAWEFMESDKIENYEQHKVENTK